MDRFASRLRQLSPLLLLLLLGLTVACTTADTATVVEAPPPTVVDAPPADAPPTPTPSAQPATFDPATATLDSALPIAPQVRYGTLDNGLRYFVRTNQRPEQRAELRLAVDVGSVLEDPDQLGLAHFVEHMAFNGTERFAKQELIDYLQSIGMRFGADINAYTAFDETVYRLTVPTDDPKLLDTAMLVFGEWAGRIAFDGEEIDAERGV
ncbi:MAG: insulinase family protein, partial [Acidobacteriota bacterium]